MLNFSSYITRCAKWKFWRPFWSTYIFANKKVLMPTSFVQKYHRTQRHFEIRYTQIIKWHFEHIKYYVKWVIFNKWSKLDTQLYATSAYWTKFYLLIKKFLLRRCQFCNSEYITVIINISLKSKSIISNIKCII